MESWLWRICSGGLWFSASLEVLEHSLEIQAVFITASTKGRKVRSVFAETLTDSIAYQVRDATAGLSGLESQRFVQAAVKHMIVRFELLMLLSCL
jgi:hypothetical protein